MVLLAAVTVATWATIRERNAIVSALKSLDWWAAPLALLAGLMGVLAIYRSWTSVVADCGIELEPRQRLRVFAVGQVGKYVPGSVWSVVTPAQLAREYGASRARMATATLIALLVSVCAALVVGCLLLPASGGRATRALWFAPVLAVPLVAALTPPVLNALIRTAGRLTRRPVAGVELSGAGTASAALWAVVANLCFGVHLQALGWGMGATGVRGFLMSTSAYALAAALGVLVFFAPAGAGVREAVITLVLAPKLTVAAALVVALLSRVAMTLVDVGLALTRVRAAGRAPDARWHPVFVTRRFPPSIGGMETLAGGVWRSIRVARPDAVLIAHGGSNKALLWWLPRAWLRLAVLVVRGRVDFVLAGDAPTYAVIEPLIRMGRVRGIVMVLGLDLTHPNVAYRALVLPPLRRADRVIAISAATREVALSVGIDPARVSVVRLGTPLPPLAGGARRAARDEICARLGLEAPELILLTLGRLVRRKGVRWFVENVLPGLPARIHYVVAGEGPETDAITKAAAAGGVAQRVHMLGLVDDSDRDLLMRGCDVFIQPNVAVAGDMEGFGLVTIEAAMRGALVVAADLEGLKDAVIPGRTGELLPSEDARVWIDFLKHAAAHPASVDARRVRYRDEARRLFAEETMGEALSEVLELPTSDERRSGAGS